MLHGAQLSLNIKAQKRLANHFDYAHGNLSRKERAHYLSIAKKAPVGGVRLQPPEVQGSLSRLAIILEIVQLKKNVKEVNLWCLS